MDENIISKITNFHYNEGDLIVIYYKIGENLNTCVEIANNVYERLKEIYPNAEIIGIPVDYIQEVTTISANDHLKSILLDGHALLQKELQKSACHHYEEDDEIQNM